MLSVFYLFFSVPWPVYWALADPQTGRNSVRPVHFLFWVIFSPCIVFKRVKKESFRDFCTFMLCCNHHDTKKKIPDVRPSVSLRRWQVCAPERLHSRTPGPLSIRRQTPPGRELLLLSSTLSSSSVQGPLK